MRILSCLAVFAFLVTAASESFAKKSRFYGSQLCNDPGFYCVKVRRGDTWARLFPDSEQRDIVMRLNRTNIAMRYRPWIVVPRDLRSIEIMDIAPFANRIDTHKKKLLLVDLKKHAFAAYNAHGYLVHWGPVSGGKGWCADVGRSCRTVIGSFRIYRKQGEGCVSSKFPLPNGGAKMPYCMHFYRGYAMHGSQLPGYHASHGCVRLFKTDALWINKNFAPIGTRVVIIR